jgi:hypothetical protein
MNMENGWGEHKNGWSEILKSGLKEETDTIEQARADGHPLRRPQPRFVFFFFKPAQTETNNKDYRFYANPREERKEKRRKRESKGKGKTRKNTPLQKKEKIAASMTLHHQDFSLPLFPSRPFPSRPSARPTESDGLKGDASQRSPSQCQSRQSTS